MSRFEVTPVVPTWNECAGLERSLSRLDDPLRAPFGRGLIRDGRVGLTRARRRRLAGVESAPALRRGSTEKRA